MKRVILTAILLLLSAAIGARAQSITVYSHTTILANGEAMAECGTVMNDSGTITNYRGVDVWCGFYQGTTRIDEFLCPEGRPSSQCQRIYSTTPGQTYQTTGEHAFYLYYYSPCLQFTGGFYDPYYYGFPAGFPIPHFDESGQRLANSGSATCWSNGPLVTAYTDSYRDTTTSVSPTQATLYESQTQQFSANRSVTWSMVQGNGEIDGNGLYRAPAAIAGQQTAVIQACDVQNSVDCARATITLKNATVTVTPPGQEVLPGTQKAYQASIFPSSFSQTVQWSRTPAVGSIDPNSGVYTAPANNELPGPVEVTIKACSTAVPTLCGTATLQVPRVTITVAGPPSFLASPGSRLTLSANVGGPVASPEVGFLPIPLGTGSVATVGFNTVEYVPPAITAAQTVTFQVCLKASPATCAQPDYPLVLVPPITISSAGTWNAGTSGPITITGTGFGASPNVLLSDASIPFSYVSRSNTSIVINATVPVSASGRTLTVTVQSSTAGITPPAASSNVTVGAVSLGISPPSATLRESQTQTFSTTCTAAGGGACAGVNSVSWFATVGSINSTGPTTALYTAPASVTSTTSVSVRACWSLAPNERCATATVTITPLTVDVTPAAVNVNGCSTQRFNVAVSNAPVTTVTWSINPQVGAIDSTGLYTAPCPVTAQSQVEVKACSTANPQKCDTSQVTLVPVTVSVTPPVANVQPGGTQQFSSVVQGTGNTAVTWSLSPAVAAAGTIDATGLYRAPSSITTVTTVTVTATSQANSNIKGTAQVNLVTASAVLTPASSTFAAQDVGTTSAAQTITLSNSGTASFSVSGISTTGDFTQTNTCPASLAPGASCAIQVRFAPTGVGTRTGTLRVTDTAPGSPHVANLSGTGRGPLASLSPVSLDFGGHRPGFASPARTVTLSNTGTGPMAISSVSVDGEFLQTNTCPSSLAAGTSCAISVRFNPTASSAGDRLGTLRVYDNAAGSPHAVSLKGGAYGGFHDVTNCNGASGWAWDPSRPNTPINVYIFEGNNLLATVLADKYRADLASSGYGNGYHAFEWTLPTSLKDGQSHTITVRYSSDSNAVHIPGSPKSTTCTAPASYQGYHDSATCQGLSGWGWDSTRPTTAITLYIFEGTVNRGSVLANQYRQDLVNAGIGDGRHGFTWALPTSLIDGQPHSLTVRFGSSASSQALTASPRTITCTPAPTPTASVEWILPAEETWGSPGTLTAAGFARDGTGTVQLQWRERSSSGVWGSWVTVSYRAPVAADGTWSNTISSGNPTDKCHWFEAKVNYSGITSATYRYTGASGCP